MNDFNVISRIGSGGFGHVFLVSLKSDSRRRRSVNDDDHDSQSVDSLSVNSSIDVDDVFAMKVIEKVKKPFFPPTFLNYINANSWYICYMCTRDNYFIILLCTHACILYFFYIKMIEKVRFNEDVVKKSFFSTSRLAFSCHGFTFLTGIWVSPCNHFDLIGSQWVLVQVA